MATITSPERIPPTAPDEANEFLSDLRDLELRMSDTFEELDTTRKRLNEDHKKLNEILNRYRNLGRDLGRLRTLYNDKDFEEDVHLKSEIVDTEDVEHRLNLLDREMRVMHENKLRVGSIWLRFLVGRTSMKVWDDAKRRQLKTEYHKFKQRTNWIFILFPMLQLIWCHYFGQISWVISQWHNIWLLYYYFTLSTREVILKLNGSKLHYWWIIHHQISSFGAFVSILLMRSAYDRYSFIFTMMIWMSLIVGCLQIWANNYQLKRHYVRLALGKDQSVDIALTESIVNEQNTKSSVEFNLLKICCYLVYLFELSVGASVAFFAIYNDGINGEKFDLFQFEAVTMGLCFMILGIGNGYALFTRPSKHMKRSGSTERMFDIKEQKMKKRSSWGKLKKAK